MASFIEKKNWQAGSPHVERVEGCLFTDDDTTENDVLVK